MKTFEVQNITGEHWDEFQEWMRGQTIGLYPDGTLNYYPWDVQRFMRRFEKE